RTSRLPMPSTRRRLKGSWASRFDAGRSHPSTTRSGEEHGALPMTKRLKITIGDVVSEATLLEEKAPKTAAAVWENLPIDGFLNHANFSGEECSLPCYPMLYEKENQLYETEHGDL